MAGNLGAAGAADARALERFTHVDGERREVREVEALELVVTKDHERVGARGRQRVAQRGEALLHAGLLHAVGREVVERHVGAQRAAGAHLVPLLGGLVGLGAVRGVEDADERRHRYTVAFRARASNTRAYSSAIALGCPACHSIGRGRSALTPSGVPRPARTRGSASLTFFMGSR